MPYDGAVSLFWIAVVAALSPLLAGLIPRRLVPEVVFLLVFGILIGPYVLGWAGSNDAIELIRELGLGMLFLLAGYEIEIREVTGRGGRRAAATWLICFVSALVAVVVIGLVSTVEAEIAVAIALTSTALGTLLPILRDNGLLRTPLGANVLNHGAYGEVGPVVAMAVLLGAHGAAGADRHEARRGDLAPGRADGAGPRRAGAVGDLHGQRHPRRRPSSMASPKLRNR